MKNLIICLLVLFSFSALAQDETYGDKDISKQDTLFYFGENSRLLIFPFEPKLYMSDIDREVGEFNGLNFQEIRGYFRLGLDNALFLEAKTNYDVISRVTQRSYSDVSIITKTTMIITP